MKLINLDVKRPSQELIDAYKKITVATAHEAMGRKGFVDSTIKPLYEGMKVCGPALTCECVEMDNITLHAAVYYSNPGDVIVCSIAKNGNWQMGPFGDCMASACIYKQINGLVIDSGVRDGEGIKSLGFNVFSRGHCINGTIKENFGKINHPLSFGGQVVNPGDIILGDDDGVVVVPLEIAEEVLAIAQKKESNEEKARAQYISGEVKSWEKYGFAERMKAKGYDLGV